MIVDGVTWPGRPVASWPPAIAGVPFEPPSGRGTARLIGNIANATAICPTCGRAVKWLTDGRLVAHKVTSERCPGSGGTPAADPALAAWVPVKLGLTPHGLRHSHKTGMIEGKIPEVLAELRLGHEIPGIRGAYSHTSEQMRQELKDALQARWENSLKARFALAPHSLVPALDKLLAPLRETGSGSERNSGSQIPPTGAPDTGARVA